MIRETGVYLGKSSYRPVLQMAKIIVQELAFNYLSASVLQKSRTIENTTIT